MNEGDPTSAINPSPADQAANKLIVGQAPERYVNFFRVLNQAEEIVLDFSLQSEPSCAGMVCHSRIVINPYFARRLHDALADQILRYEKVFGTLDVEVMARMIGPPLATT